MHHQDSMTCSIILKKEKHFWSDIKYVCIYTYVAISINQECGKRLNKFSVNGKLKMNWYLSCFLCMYSAI